MYKLLGTWRLGRLVVMNMKNKKIKIIIVLVALVVLITAGVINYISYTSDKTYVYDTNNIKKCDVMWVGLSAKKVQNINNSIPLENNTNSGKILYNEYNNCFVEGNKIPSLVLHHLPKEEKDN